MSYGNPLAISEKNGYTIADGRSKTAQSRGGSWL
jgi:hypothetical protein